MSDGSPPPIDVAGDRPLFTATVTHDSGIARIALSGELDIASVHVVDDLVEQLRLTAPPRAVLDLSGLDFVDLTGVRALAAAHQRLGRHGRPLDVVGMSPLACRVAEFAGVRDELVVDAGQP